MLMPDQKQKFQSNSSGSGATRAVACTHCELSGFLSLIEEMLVIKVDLFDTMLLRKQSLLKGESLFRKDQPFYGIFAVQKGSFKSYAQPLGGDEQVLGFHFPGEILGLESLMSPSYKCTIRALESSAVCQLNLKNQDIPEEFLARFQQQKIEILTRQINWERRQSLLAARQTAEERMAVFLFNLSERFAERNIGGDEFFLPMLRSDIASYLGLSMETVSRTLSRFREQNLLSIKGKRVRLLDIPCIRSMAQHCSLEDRAF
jgi:CRP/FNR family transcriptional regulator, anaerobic regulatory protein